MKIKLFFGVTVALCFVVQTGFATIGCGMLGYNFVEKNEKYCPEDKPFYGTGCGGCFGCDTLDSMVVREDHVDDIKICQNRTLIKSESGSYYESILTKCPIGTPLRRKWGNECESCDTVSSVFVKEKSDCDVCLNRIYFPKQEGGSCVLKECPESHPIQTEYGCYECDAESALPATKEECQKCSNRKMQKILKNEWCILISNNNKEKPLVPIPPQSLTDSGCFDNLCSFSMSCDTERDISTTKKNCDKCPNRTYKDGKCILVSCESGKIKTGAGCLSCEDAFWPMICGEECVPTKFDCDKCPNRIWDEEYQECYLKNCPEGYFKAEKGCYSCSDNWYNRMHTTAEECAKCPERTYLDGECFIKGK